MTESPKPLAALITWIRTRVLPLASQLPGGARPWISLASIGFVIAALLSHGRQLLQLSLDPQGWLWLLMGVGLSLLSLVVNGLAWAEVLRWLGLRPRWEAATRLYMVTNLRKFLPGGIWHLAARVQTLRGAGEAVAEAPPVAAPVGTAGALLAVLLDPLLAAVAALALVPVAGWQNGLGLLCLLPLLLLLPRWLDPLLQRLEQQRRRVATPGAPCWPSWPSCWCDSPASPAACWPLICRGASAGRSGWRPLPSPGPWGWWYLAPRGD